MDETMKPKKHTRGSKDSIRDATDRDVSLSLEEMEDAICDIRYPRKKHGGTPDNSQQRSQGTSSPNRQHSQEKTNRNEEHAKKKPSVCLIEDAFFQDQQNRDEKALVKHPSLGSVKASPRDSQASFKHGPAVSMGSHRQPHSVSRAVSRANRSRNVSRHSQHSSHHRRQPEDNVTTINLGNLSVHRPENSPVHIIEPVPSRRHRGHDNSHHHVSSYSTRSSRSSHGKRKSHRHQGIHHRHPTGHHKNRSHRRHSESPSRRDHRHHHHRKHERSQGVRSPNTSSHHRDTHVLGKAGHKHSPEDNSEDCLHCDTASTALLVNQKHANQPASNMHGPCSCDQCRTGSFPHGRTPAKSTAGHALHSNAEYLCSDCKQEEEARDKDREKWGFVLGDKNVRTRTSDGQTSALNPQALPHTNAGGPGGENSWLPWSMLQVKDWQLLEKVQSADPSEEPEVTPVGKVQKRVEASGRKSEKRRDLGRTKTLEENEDDVLHIYGNTKHGKVRLTASKSREVSKDRPIEVDPNRSEPSKISDRPVAGVVSLKLLKTHGINDYIGYILMLYTMDFGTTAIFSGITFQDWITKKIKRHIYTLAAVAGVACALFLLLLVLLYFFEKVRRKFILGYILFGIMVLSGAIAQAVFSRIGDNVGIAIFNGTAAVLAFVVILLTKIRTVLTVKLVGILCGTTTFLHICITAVVFYLLYRYGSMNPTVTEALVSTLMAHIVVAGAFVETTFFANRHLSKCEGDELYPILVYFCCVLILPMALILILWAFKAREHQDIATLRSDSKEQKHMAVQKEIKKGVVKK